jgi:cell division protein FtsL
MTKTITVTVDVPEWVDEVKLKKKIYGVVNELSDKDYKIKRLKKLISELNFDEKDLERFEEVREEVWKERKKEYGL